MMPIAVLLFFLGILSSTFFPRLPSPMGLILIAITAFLFSFHKKTALRYIAMVGLGYCWALTYALFILSDRSTKIENKPVWIEGYIASIPIQQDCLTSFDFKTTKFSQNPSTKVHLSWVSCQAKLRVGEKWRLMVKLKRPHALMNKGSFDLEKHYFQKHLCACGVVLKNCKHRKLACHYRHYPIQCLRQSILESVPPSIRHSPFFGVILALSLGISTFITPAQWQVFKLTGTNHLVAISGLHIGLVATLVSKIMGLIWARASNAVLFMPTVHVQAVFGLIAAIAYSFLAGFSASTQRAVIMIGVAVVAKLIHRQLSTFRALMLSLGLMNCCNPFAFLSCGFWLSFLAVGLLVYGMGFRLDTKGFWQRLARPQWVVAMGMLPTLIYFFQQVSLLPLLANLLAIPWISFFVVPCSLLGMGCLLFSNSLGTFFLQLASYLLQLIWWVLEKLSNFDAFVWNFAFSSYFQNVITHISAYITLFPSGLIYRLICGIWWLPIFFTPMPVLKPGYLQLVVLDVGQGLAVLVRTQQHNLIYDTGVKTNHLDMGKAVIVPYLLQEGIRKIDTLTISHGDNDHIGGAASLLQAMPVSRIITSVPERFKNRKPQFCTDGLSWQWDGVKFKFLSAFSAGHSMKGNNGSCVLKIENNRHSILLTGDIEKKVETLLIKKHARELKSTILIVPHHGSKTSSSVPFLESVQPTYAIVSCGYLNIYHHPHTVIVSRYREKKIKFFNTVSSGAITMTLFPNSGMVNVEEYRKTHHKIWH